MKIAPSILTADFLDLERELRSVSDADFLHLDIMDGNFVPNISFGPSIAKQIASATEVELDIHLMVTDPVKWIEEFVYPTTKFITVHYESNDVLTAINKIKDNNVQVGLSIKPGTEIEDVLSLLPLVDLVLIMTVEPGFGGQSFIPSSVDKIKELNEIRQTHGFDFLIEVDGGITSENVDLVEQAGADIAVVGSYLFNQKRRNQLIDLLR